MRKARLITIGTEITSGEVVNVNASWVSLKLEDMGMRVFSHLSVRDQRDEILRALKTCGADDLIVVTGGLGPTSDDLTRECLALHLNQVLEFDEKVWRDLSALYAQRQLPLREAHKHQCYFPSGSERLRNPVGTALGFAAQFGDQRYFVLPGPPRELEAMWMAEVVPRLRSELPVSSRQWLRWTCLGAPESEVAELVEATIKGLDLEVGYRAQVPYVKVKVYLDPHKDRAVVEGLEKVLAPFVVGRAFEDLAEELLQRWPLPDLHVCDALTERVLFERLLKAAPNRSPRLALDLSAPVHGLVLRADGEEFVTEVRLPSGVHLERKILPYKLKLDSERGRRSAVEWAVWSAVRALRSQSSTST
ncbi:MAG: competence/damage-inducible protein A [Bdellovibrionales bacterium]|nr:competence/damage-inducible protein A [Bdellovibrionales bacterium]